MMANLTVRVLTFVLLPLLVFAGCTEKQEGQDESSPVETPAVLAEASPDLVEENEVEQEDLNVTQVGKRHVSHGFRWYPEDREYSAELLITGVLHNEDVGENPGDKAWMALTISEEGEYALSEVVPTFERVKDVIGDGEEDEPSGWEVRVASEDSVLVLMTNLDGLEAGAITSAPEMERTLAPGNKFMFVYNDNDYHLQASEKRERITEKEREYTTVDYLLELLTTIDSVEFVSLLTYCPFIDGGQIEILFCGDLDRDGSPDLLIDNSCKYNAFRPALYLSSKASSGELIKVVAKAGFVGC